MFDILNFLFLFSKLRVGVENLYEVMKEEKIPADDKLIEEVLYQSNLWLLKLVVHVLNIAVTVKVCTTLLLQA